MPLLLLKVPIILLVLFMAYAILVRTNTAWVLNRFMVLGAGLGVAMFLLISDIVRVCKHKGPGYVTYGDEDHDDYTEKVSESDYKSHHLVNDGFLLLVTIAAWIEGARRATARELEHNRPNQTLHPTADHSLPPKMP